MVINRLNNIVVAQNASVIYEVLHFKKFLW